MTMGSKAREIGKAIVDFLPDLKRDTYPDALNIAGMVLGYDKPAVKPAKPVELAVQDADPAAGMAPPAPRRPAEPLHNRRIRHAVHTMVPKG